MKSVQAEYQYPAADSTWKGIIQGLSKVNE